MPLDLQKHLRSGGTLDELENDLALRLHHHPDLPLVGFAYHQLDSPKTHPIVREARGVVLEKGSWRIVAKAFNRFFNLGEVADEYKTFNWSNFDCYTKADGSLVLAYHYKGKWYAKTRGSFGDGIVQNGLPDYQPSYSQLFWDIMRDKGIDPDKVFDPEWTYVFELCSKYNKVVRTYEKPAAYLLTVVRNETAQELPHEDTDCWARENKVCRVDRHHFSSLEEIKDYIKHLEDTDPTNEGVIICDDKWLRYKIKSSTYLGLHHLLDNGNLYNPKRLVPWAMKEDPAELLNAFPEVREHFDAVKGKLDEAYSELHSVWEKHYRIEDQKAFAQAIRGKTPFMGILFNLRKKAGTRTPSGGFTPGPQTEKQLRDAWRDNPVGIVKALFS
jgi:hypothetical protein